MAPLQFYLLLSLVFLSLVLLLLLFWKARQLAIENSKFIAERNEAEAKIMKANRLYFFISQVNQMIVKTSDEATLFKEACRIAIELGKFKMAWIGIMDEDSKLLRPVMHDSIDTEYLSAIKIIAGNYIPEGRRLIGAALQQGKYLLSNDIETDPRMVVWSAEALKLNYLSSITLPIMKSGKVIGAFTLYADTKNFFDAEEIALLEETAGNISFALNVLEKEMLRKKAEEVVLKKERRYQTLAESSPVGIFHTDATGYTTYVNPRWCLISGLSFEEALGNGWFSVVHPEDKPALAKGWQEATKRQQTSSTEYRFARPDGTIAWVIGQAVPEKNTENEIIGYVGTITDITERREAEQEIARIYKEKEIALNRINDSVVSLDNNWRYTFLNEAAMATHPEGKSEIIGKTIWEVHPELVGTVFAKKYEEAMLTKIVVEFEDYYAPKDKWYFIKVYPSVDGLTIFYENITEHKKAEVAIKANEQKLELIYNTTRDVLFLLSVENGGYLFTSVNQSFLDITGLEKEQVIGHFVHEIIPEPSLSIVLKNYRAAIDHKQSFQWEETSDYPSGSRTGIVSVTPVFDERGNCTMLIGVVHDITDRKKAEEDIKNTAEQLRQLTTHLQTIREEERKRIGREIHDDLGQQLTAIKMDVAWIDKKTPEETTLIKAKLKNIITLLDGSSKSIRRILSELRPGVLDDHGLLDAIQWLGNQFTANTGIPVKFHTAEKVVKSSAPVANCIFRVYQEALTNITRYANARTVTSSLIITDDDIIVTIKDDGQGFDVVSVQNKKSFGILGMKERVLSLDGKFELISSPGKGTKVTISLPYSISKNI
jgi:PAS domain S-box-containing protein